MSRVLVLGSVNEDITVFVDRRPSPGETLLATSIHRAVGGKGANQALAAAREGADVLFFGAVGRDAAGAEARSVLRSARVDTSELIASPDASTGTAVITVTPDGENTILVVPAANHTLSARAMAARIGELGGAPGSVVLTQGELAPAVLVELAGVVSAVGARWVLNLAPFIPLPIDVLRRASVLVVNESELASLAEFLEAPPSAEAFGQHLGAPLVVTLGADGALLVEHGTTTRVPAEPVREVVDTAGAGDAFVGALAAGLASGDTLAAAVARGSRLGAVAVSRRGAALLPSTHPATTVS